MRIVMISPTIGDAFGQERVMRHSADLLRSKGAEIYFLGDKQQGALPQCSGHHLVDGLSGLHSLSSPVRVRRSHKEAFDFVASVKPDVVHFIDQFDNRFVGRVLRHFPTVFTAHTVAPTCPASTRLIYENAVCGELSGWKCVWNHHRYKCLPFLKNDVRRVHAVHNYLQRRRCLAKARSIFAISRYLSGLLARDGWPAEKIRLVFNPVEVPAKPIPPIAQVPRNLIVCASRLVGMKGIDYLLRALRSLMDLEWTLWICGDGPQRSYLEGLSSQYGLSKRVDFRGRTPYAETQAIVASSRLLVQPNLGPEGFGLSAAEASALGVPVVAFRVPAIDEIVVQGETGLLSPPRDIDRLAVDIRRVLGDDGFVEKCRTRGPEHIREHFSPQAHLEATWRNYLECAAKNPTARA